MTKRRCYLCNNASDFRVITDQLRRGERIPILECTKCGLVFLDTAHPNFKNEEYSQADYLSRNCQLYGNGGISSYDKLRVDTYRQKAKEVLPKLHPDADVLEVGCGCGSFLSLIHTHVRSTVGIEINRPLSEYARKKLAIFVYTEPVETVKLKQKFDAIFLLQVIDHLSDPLLVLKKLRGLLKKDGFIYVECPNTDEVLMRYLPEKSRACYQRFYYHLAHLWYFKKQTLETLFAKAGLECEIRNVHDWTFMNFLNWWYVGTPSKNIKEAQMGVVPYGNRSDRNAYMRAMNEFFERTDHEFKNIVARYGLASTFVCEARL